MKKTSTRKVKVVELVFYILAGVVALVGLTSTVFGIVGHHLNVPLKDNWIKTAESNIVLDFRIWGIILLASAAVIAVIVLVIFAQGADRQYEKTLRRQQRLTSSAVSEMEIKPAVQTVDVTPEEVKPAPEAPKEEPKAEPEKAPEEEAK